MCKAVIWLKKTLPNVDIEKVISRIEKNDPNLIGNVILMCIHNFLLNYLIEFIISILLQFE